MKKKESIEQTASHLGRRLQISVLRKGFNNEFTRHKAVSENPKESKYHTLIVKVNKSTPKIHSMTVKTKDGMTLYYTITKLTPNIEVGDSKFKFDPAKNPGVEVEEL